MGGTACPSHTKSISLAASLRNPFLADIIDTLLPPTWKGVTLDKYDVTTNLDEHIDNNVVQEGLFIMDDIVLCKTKIGREEKIDQEVALEREENTDQPRRVINTIAKGLQVKDVPLRQGRSTWAMFDS
ncbi:hypothetical protein JHK87_000739 [Glycine soja]|nr:hypothetical protein JHK87_000739 [Glycine soja]